MEIQVGKPPKTWATQLLATSLPQLKAFDIIINFCSFRPIQKYMESDS